MAKEVKDREKYLKIRGAFGIEYVNVKDVHFLSDGKYVTIILNGKQFKIMGKEDKVTFEALQKALDFDVVDI
jgi:DNA-binding LytR/AlgR family response regulator